MKRTFVNPVIKDTATFIKLSSETEGKFTELELTIMPSGGNPVHYHKTFSETFKVLDGQLTLFAGKQKIVLQPGESFTVEPFVPHRFLNETEDAVKCNIVFNPGHEGMENFIRVLYGLAADGLTNEKSIPKSFKHTALILTASDSNAPGLLSLLNPVLKFVAKRAIAKGEWDVLLKKYS